MLLFVGTPNLSSRIGRLSSKLVAQSSRLSSDMQEKALNIVSEFLEARWESVRYLTFAENESFLNEVIELAVSEIFIYSYIT
jgi:hypothetical protein